MTGTAMDQVLAIIARDRQASGVSPDRLDVGAARASLPPTELPAPEGTVITKVKVEGTDCAWVVAPGADLDHRIAYLHGGGFVAGGLHSHRSLVGWLSKAAQCAVLAIDYSLAPETRFPSQIDEGGLAWAWLALNGPAGPSQASTLYLAGDSAGAAIGVGLMQEQRRKGDRLPDRAVFLCPMLDLDATTSPFVRSNQRMRDIVAAYIRDPDDLANPLASPILAALEHMPPMLIQTGSKDDAIQDSERFARNAEDAGVDVTLKIWPDMFHVWQRFAPLLPEAKAALEEAGAFLRGQAV